jgi:UDPglucose 6-dehydrogenase
VQFCSDAYAAAEDADAVVLVTEWNEFKNLDLARVKATLRRPLLIDGRNLYEPSALIELGFEYIGVARAPVSMAESAVEMMLRD